MGTALPMTPARRHAINLARYQRQYAGRATGMCPPREWYPHVEPIGKRWSLKWLRECFKLGMLK